MCNSVLRARAGLFNMHQGFDRSWGIVLLAAVPSDLMLYCKICKRVLRVRGVLYNVQQYL
jgi:hypothetical protein